MRAPEISLKLENKKLSEPTAANARWLDAMGVKIVLEKKISDDVESIWENVENEHPQFSQVNEKKSGNLLIHQATSALTMLKFSREEKWALA